MRRVYFLEIKSELLKFARMRAYTIFTVAFPLMFYCFFGLAMGQQKQGGFMPLSRYLLATYGAFAVMGSALSAFGVGVAIERGMGWLEVKRASPMPPAAYFVAKGAVAMAFGALVVGLLFGLGAVFGGVRMPLAQWLALGGALVLGAIPFGALGLAIACFVGPNSAPPVVNLVYLPMAFCAGLWIPINFLPHAMQQLAPLLPAYHLGQIALAILHAPGSGNIVQHAEALVAFTLVFAGIAWVGNSREHEKMYG
jgi:ABC-2 type transport system permease protein